MHFQTGKRLEQLGETKDALCNKIGQQPYEIVWLEKIPDGPGMVILGFYALSTRDKDRVEIPDMVKSFPNEISFSCCL